MSGRGRHTNWRDRSSEGASDAASIPALVDGVELIGEYEGSGYREAPYIARRPDGKVVQLTHLLHLVAERADGQASYATVADEVGAAYGKKVAADDVQFLVEERLRPLGLVVDADGSDPEYVDKPHFLQLTYRTAVVPDRAVQTIAAIFQPLFFGPIVVAVVAAVLAFDVWMFGVHGVGQSFRETLSDPNLVLASLGVLVLSAAFHEIGHAAACRYGGARPGAMGAGLYIIWPVFYTDVTDSYRLGRGGRLRVDLGGVYFNLFVVLALAGIYAATGAEWVLAIALIQHIEIGRQLLPFLRLDGYYVVADLTGVPDLFTRMKPILRSMLPWKGQTEKVRELKPWVRWAVTGWVLLVIPFLLFNLGVLLLNFPRIAATTWQAAGEQWAGARGHFGDGKLLAGFGGVAQLIALLLPVAGIAGMFYRLIRTFGAAGWRRTEDRPFLRGAYSVGMAGALGALAFVWWPNGDYRPIEEGERWTAQETIRAWADVPSGAPGIRPRIEAESRGELVASTSSSDGSGTEGGVSGEGGAPQDGAVPAPEPSPSPSASPTPSPSSDSGATTTDATTTDSSTTTDGTSSSSASSTDGTSSGSTSSGSTSSGSTSGGTTEPEPTTSPSPSPSPSASPSPSPSPTASPSPSPSPSP